MTGPGSAKAVRAFVGMRGAVGVRGPIGVRRPIGVRGPAGVPAAGFARALRAATPPPRRLPPASAAVPACPRFGGCAPPDSAAVAPSGRDRGADRAGCARPAGRDGVACWGGPARAIWTAGRGAAVGFARARRPRRAERARPVPGGHGTRSARPPSAPQRSWPPGCCPSGLCPRRNRSPESGRRCPPAAPPAAATGPSAERAVRPVSQIVVKVTHERRAGPPARPTFARRGCRLAAGLGRRLGRRLGRGPEGAGRRVRAARPYPRHRRGRAVAGQAGER